MTQPLGIPGTARFSACGNYRWTLTRRWDDRPVLLVVMFNPSTATAFANDQTVGLVSRIAAHNGYGGVVVVNGIPLCDPKPSPAVAMTTWEKTSDWAARDHLQNNLAVIAGEASKAGAVLIAWGALARRCPGWFQAVIEEIEASLQEGVHIHCLGKTVKGYPKHPMARGKHKVPKDAPLLRWKDPAA